MRFTLLSTLFTTAVLSAWTATPAFGAKVDASTITDDKDAKAYPVDSESSTSLRLSGRKPFTKRSELTAAVNEYCDNPGAWKNSAKFAKYGPIENFNVSKITNMSFLFRSKQKCNPDISKWNTSKVTTFSDMFHHARSFNQDISTWDTSKATDFSLMFTFATSFNQDISTWDVSKGKKFNSMFFGASSFDQNLCDWQIRSDADTSAYCARTISCGCSSAVM